MEALHAAGRDAEAIDRYALVRTRLAEAAGHRPRPGAARAARGDPARRAAGPGARSGRRPTPAQLPPDVYGFTGREAQLRRAGRPAGRDARPPGGDRSGMAGIGKTALAVHWAHQAARQLPRRAAVRQPARLRSRPARRSPRPRPCAGSSTRSTCRRSASRPPSRPRSASTAACWPAGGSWSCWTTPATSSRSARCCPARPAAWPWSPAATGSPAWSPPRARTR